MAVLSEPNRRRLLELLSTGEQTVSQLAAQFGVTRSAISQHLGVLSNAGLVQARQVGRFRYYRLDQVGMSALRDALEIFGHMSSKNWRPSGRRSEDTTP